MKILFLYTELADYTLACLKALKQNNVNPQITVVHYPVNPEAPFDFDFGEIGTFVSIKKFPTYSSLKKYIDAFNPGKIVVSGWANKWYLRVCAAYRKKAICVLTMDNRWTGRLKQRLLTLAFRSLFISVFKKIWVPGEPQVKYARKLGFKEWNIITGFYCCDVDFYLTMGKQAFTVKENDFPKRLLCVARYIPAKNYNTLWDAFVQWKNETNNDWELWCAGIGEGYEKRKEHPSIRHLGFIQKETWSSIIAQTGIFVLPSSFEPWSVAVQEFAAAGYPLILSSKVGAATAFMQNENGWLFNPFDKEALVGIFKELETMPPKSLNAMSNRSMEIAKRITPSSWAAVLVEA